MPAEPLYDLSRRGLLAGLAALPMMPAMAIAAPASVRRGYADGPFGQVHYRIAAPEAPSAPPLFCFHQSPNSSQVFGPFLPAMAADRMVVAADTPGFGMSDAPAEQPDIADYARAMMALIDALSPDQPVDLLGYHTGACIATELALSYADRIRRVIMIGIPVFNEQEAQFLIDNPFPGLSTEDGSHVMREWEGSLRWRGPGQSIESVVRTFLAKMQTGDTGWWGANAAARYPLGDKLALISQPVMLVNPQDDLWEISPRAREALPSARYEPLEQFGFGIFDAAPEEIADLCRDFLSA